MTQPSQMQLIVCQLCGSVRVPVPAIVKQQRLTILAANGQPTAEIDPCPVCAMLAKFLEEEEPRVRTIPGPREEKSWKGKDAFLLAVRDNSDLYNGILRTCKQIDVDRKNGITYNAEGKRVESTTFEISPSANDGLMG